MISMEMTFQECVDSIFCVKCGDWGRERHHVTYRPATIKLLCTKCHKRITHINTRESRRVPKGACWRKLSNKTRIRLWERFLNAS